VAATVKITAGQPVAQVLVHPEGSNPDASKPMEVMARATAEVVIEKRGSCTDRP
jgi:hypothetical protein